MEYKDVAKARVKSIYNDLVVLDKKSAELRESLTSTTVSLQERKRNMETLGLKFEDFKSDIRRISLEHYESEIVSINIKHLVSSLYETLIQLGLSGVDVKDLDLEEEVVSSIVEIASQAKPVFTSDNGKFVVANEELHKEIFQMVEARVANEGVLKNTFDLIPIDKAQVL